MFRLRSVHCMFRWQSVSSRFRVQSVHCIFRWQSVPIMFRLQSGHSSDYSDGLTVQDVRMAHCWKMFSLCRGLLTIILSFQTVQTVQRVQKFQNVQLKRNVWIVQKGQTMSEPSGLEWASILHTRRIKNETDSFRLFFPPADLFSFLSPSVTLSFFSIS